MNANFKITILILFIVCSFALDAVFADRLFASEENLNQTEADKGDILPARFIHGHVTRQAGRYILGTGDVVEFKVNELDQYNQKFTIGPDGFASINPFGEYYIAGIDLNGLETWLEEKFKYYLLKPEVTVSIAELRPALIYLMGAVRRPGPYQFLRTGLNNALLKDERTEKVEIGLTNILARTGGVMENADLRNITVIHSSTKQQVQFDLLEFLTSGKGEDIILMPGDKVIVNESKDPIDPETFKLLSRSGFYNEKFPVMVLGAVNSQGEVQVSSTNNSLNAAIALAGGFSSASKRDKILIQRADKKGGFQNQIVDRKNIELALQPGDVVFVPNRKMAGVERWLKIITGISQNYFYGTAATNIMQTILSDNNNRTILDNNDN